MNRVDVVKSHLDRAKTAPVIAVLGSCFIDYVAYVDRCPKPGETLPCKQFQKGFGGKGANQAIMAGKLGANTKMISVVGDDGDGDAYINNFKGHGVDVSSLLKVANESTGLAMIFVETTTGQNSIVICPNATERFRPSVKDVSAALQGTKVLITQNEIPLSTTLAGIRFARENIPDVLTIFNPAPAPNPADEQARRSITEHLKFVDIFCPNETEASLLCGFTVDDVASAQRACRELQRKGARSVVVTLGSQGCVVADRSTPPKHVPAPKVRAVDTTGAGDCFIGALAYFIANLNCPLEEACRRANICAADSVTKKGTQSSYAGRANLPSELFSS